MIIEFVDYIQDTVVLLLEIFVSSYSMKMILGCLCYYSFTEIMCYFLLILGITEDA